MKNYIKDMEQFDKSLVSIKSHESNDEIESIVMTLKRATDKNVEMYSKLNEVKNEIDNFELKFDSERQEVLKLMREVAKVKRVNTDTERLIVMEKRTHKNVLNQ